MFSKSKITETTDKPDAARPTTPAAPAHPGTAAAAAPAAPTYAAKPKPSPSLLSSDIVVKGNLITSGDIQIEGKIEGDVRAHLLTVG
ncbi:MAG: polymer-forming cytoskeletal protein, partial [Thermohalobaculum sp.]|nr:polymer-forming cytoskeletal protein [Thermohalobaculum sp.]